MRKNKGFTLVELLAVIVILAVIALIATPQVLSMIESSRKGAAESSMLSYVDATEKAIISSLMNTATNPNYEQIYKVNATNALQLDPNPEQKECMDPTDNATQADKSGTPAVCPTGYVANPKHVTITLDVKGDQPVAGVTDSKVEIGDKNEVKEAKLKFGKYYVSYFYHSDTGASVYCAKDNAFPTESECQ